MADGACNSKQVRDSRVVKDLRALDRTTQKGKVVYNFKNMRL